MLKNRKLYNGKISRALYKQTRSVIIKSSVTILDKHCCSNESKVLCLSKIVLSHGKLLINFVWKLGAFLFSKIGSRFQFFKLFLELEKIWNWRSAKKPNFARLTSSVFIHDLSSFQPYVFLYHSFTIFLSLALTHILYLSPCLSLSAFISLHLSASLKVTDSLYTSVFVCHYICASLTLPLYVFLTLSLSLSLSLFLQLLLRLPDISCIRKTDCLTH